MEASGKLAEAIGCAPTPDEDPIFLRVGQSGPHLRMELKDGMTVPLRGDVDGTTLTAESPQVAKGHDRRPGQAPNIHLRAQVDRNAQPQTLNGTLQVDGCDAHSGGPGSSVPFRAIREVSNGGMF
jgi:hypothetical protein